MKILTCTLYTVQCLNNMFNSQRILYSLSREQRFQINNGEQLKRELSSSFERFCRPLYQLFDQSAHRDSLIDYVIEIRLEVMCAPQYGEENIDFNQVRYSDNWIIDSSIQCVLSKRSLAMAMATQNRTEQNAQCQGVNRGEHQMAA